MSDSGSSKYQGWVRELSTRNEFGRHDRLGTLHHIDAAARLRAAAAVTEGRPVSLVRALDDEPSCEVQMSITDVLGDYDRRFGVDEVRLECHGLFQTHMDALTHVSFDGTWYSGWPIGEANGPSIADWSHGIFTGAVHADIGAARGTAWAEANEPVEGADIDAALAAAGTSFRPGDALLLDMGRDRYEASGGELVSQFRADRHHMQPGVGVSGAEWIVDNRVSVLAWDFYDAVHPNVPRFCVHPLIWAIGLVIVDNCTFDRLRSAVGTMSGAPRGALVLGPLPIPGGTGSSVNPLVVL